MGEAVRLPWYQIEEVAIERALMLGRLLGVPEEQGIGIAVRLWQWALRESPDGDFSGCVPDAESIAAAVNWPSIDAARLVTQLQRVGLIATTPGLRVLGLDRYRAAWLRNRRKNAVSRPREANH